MARTVRNLLQIRGPLSSGAYELIGYLRGKRYRKRGELGELTGTKRDLELELEAEASARSETRLVQTWLSDGQLRDAEAAVTLAGPRSLVECVRLAPAPITSAPELKPAMAAFWAEVAHLNRRPRTLDNLDSRIGSFLVAGGFAKPFAKRFSRKKDGRTWAPDEGVKLEEVTATVTSWLAREGATDRTKINDITALGRLFRFWVKRGWIHALPEMDRKSLRPRPADPKILTPEECRRLLRSAAPGMLPYVVLGLWGFIRPKELVRLTWDDIDFEPETRVRIGRATSKTSHFRVVQLPDGARKILEGCRRRGLPVTPESNFDGQFEDLRRDAGLLEGWQPDILRHTGISYHYAATGDLTATCRKAGNSTDVLFRHYLALATKETADYFFGVLSRFRFAQLARASLRQ